MSCKKRKDPVGSTVHYNMMNYKVILVSTWWYWVSRCRYWLKLCGDGSGQIGTVWYLVVQGQYRAIMLLYIEKVEVWSGVTDVLQTHRQPK